MFVNFTVRLTDLERARLQRLADQSRRSPASVIRILLDLADLPENRRALGLPVDEQSRQPAEVQT